MSVNNVQGVNVAPMAQNNKPNMANKASNFFKAYSEKEVNDKIVLSQGREEKNGKLTFASKVTQGAGVLAMLLSIPKLAAKEAPKVDVDAVVTAAKKVKGKTGAITLAVLGAIGIMAGAILDLVNKVDAKKALVNPPSAEEMPQPEEAPVMEQPLVTEQPAVDATFAPEQSAVHQTLPEDTGMPAQVTAQTVEAPQVAQQFAPIDAKINEIAATV